MKLRHENSTHNLLTILWARQPSHSTFKSRVYNLSNSLNTSEILRSWQAQILSGYSLIVHQIGCLKSVGYPFFRAPPTSPLSFHHQHLLDLAGTSPDVAASRCFSRSSTEKAREGPTTGTEETVERGGFSTERRMGRTCFWK